mmetsp:Transcript_119639/g.333904  ORF Transcript_119639/g.333904 Transcript_119639/m.333904 type:complete len:243 (-) Transcript_119639:35-763(-)
MSLSCRSCSRACSATFHLSSSIMEFWWYLISSSSCSIFFFAFSATWLSRSTFSFLCRACTPSFCLRASCSCRYEAYSSSFAQSKDSGALEPLTTFMPVREATLRLLWLAPLYAETLVAASSPGFFSALFWRRRSRRPRLASVTSADFAKCSTSRLMVDEATEHSSASLPGTLWPKRPLNLEVRASFSSSRLLRFISFSRRLSESLELTEKEPSDCDVFRRLIETAMAENGGRWVIEPLGWGQ